MIPAEQLARNLLAVRARIRHAAQRVGRDPATIQLVCVTKTVDADTVRALHALGERDFGENRVVPGAEKIVDCAFPATGPDAARWHLIGHLQRNKVDQALNAGFRRIHSVESPRLVETLARRAEARDVDIAVWIEANPSGETAKYGVPPDALPALADAVHAHPRLHLRGLMAMAPFTDTPETSRPVFRTLRMWRDRMMDASGEPLSLSMGMSGDFEVAIEEGADIVRVGSALFV